MRYGANHLDTPFTTLTWVWPSVSPPPPAGGGGRDSSPWIRGDRFAPPPLGASQKAVRESLSAMFLASSVPPNVSGRSVIKEKCVRTPKGTKKNMGAPSRSKTLVSNSARSSLRRFPPPWIWKSRLPPPPGSNPQKKHWFDTSSCSRQQGKRVVQTFSNCFSIF